jgi:hypothetical protein
MRTHAYARRRSQNWPIGRSAAGDQRRWSCNVVKSAFSPNFPLICGPCARDRWRSRAAGWVPAQAAGCLKGAAVGGVARHYAGHHGVVGAGAGCVVGHHEATKHAREKAQQQQQGSSSDS